MPGGGKGPQSAVGKKELMEPYNSGSFKQKMAKDTRSWKKFVAACCCPTVPEPPTSPNDGYN